jgi:hypothetical protein
MIKNTHGTLSISGYTVTGHGTYFHLSDVGDMLFIVGHDNVYQVAAIESAEKMYLSERVTQTITDDSYTITDSVSPYTHFPLPYQELEDTDTHLREAFYLLDKAFAETKGI